MKISIIIPTFNKNDPILNVLNSLIQQTLIPDEIIVVDSSVDNEIELLIQNFKSNIPIIYHWVPHAYPGHARNLGVMQSKSDIIAFIDSKTVPNKNWLYDYKKLLIENQYSVIFGITSYNSKNNFQKIVQAATFGNLLYETIPGSMMLKKEFIKLKGFRKDVRAGEDQDLMLKIKNNNRYFSPNKNYLFYEGLPNNVFECLKKYFIYSYHTAKVDIQNNLKNLYLFIFILLLIMINFKIKDYIDINLLNVNLTFFYLFILLSVLIINFTIKIVFKKIDSYFSKITLFISIIIIFLIIYRWNNDIAEWMVGSLYYIPHITKLYLSFLVVISICYRGLLLPFNKKTKSNLFPFNWIKIGLLGLLIDVVKAPGYIYGSIINPIIYMFYLKNKSDFFENIIEVKEDNIIRNKKL